MGWLDPALAAALRQLRITFFAWAEFQLPGYPLRLLDGSGELSMGGHIWRGRDPVYGCMETAKGWSDGAGDSAPTLTLGMLPPGDTGLAKLLDPAAQGSAVTIGFSVLNPVTGQPIGEPCVMFTGELDVATIKWTGNERRVDWLVSSIGERLFQIDEGLRLSDALHQKVWPGQLGLEFVTGVEENVDWGQAPRAGAVVTGTAASGLGGTWWRPAAAAL